MSKKPEETPWQRLINTALSKNQVQETHVLVVGDSASGKRSLLTALLASQNQKNEISLKYEDSLLAERRRKYEHLYLFDYRYLKVTRFEDDDASEIGKAHFYSLNKKFEVG